MEIPKNLRTMVPSPEAGKPVEDTTQLKPNAHRTSAENSKNETKQYTTSGSGFGGPYGAMNTNS